MGVNGEAGERSASRETRHDREPREIRVEIGELALHGFRVDPERVSVAFERELTRLVQIHGVPLAADGALTLDALSGLPPLPAGLSARRLGQELARAVHEGLSGHGEVTR
ncbi:DUF4424 domain-containing protein [Streptomyces sp. AC550_RSS872]|uniref:DUF4424 domain-containing protein n=1 Tax=Streptomyces sp. AC550_RSS872 TaxID=2823689 RepID=UPI0020B79F01|nr:DUF4424 domain-containing protein [Streptomyces sp. AC550_RSS872]